MRILLTTLLVFCAFVRAADFQPLEDIRAAAISATAHGDAAGATAEATLDPNLQMPRCGQPLQAQSGARSVAEIACSGPTAWKLYVPVRISRAQSVAVLARPVAAGQAVTADAISMERRDVSTLIGGGIYDPSQAIGRVATRTLVAGNPLLESDLASPRVVRRGEAVMLVARLDGVDVRAPGRALGEAGLNERVNVENVGSHRIVQGVVRANGEVEVAQ